jgi:hypothetical protein
MESQYRQLVWGQSLRPVGGISRAELLDVHRLCQRWLRNIDAGTLHDGLAERLPHSEIVLRSFDVDRHQNRLVPEFLKIIGANGSFVEKAGAGGYVANASRPVVDTAILYGVWRGGLDATTINVLAKSLVANASLPAEYYSGLRLQLIPQDSAECARAAYVATRARFPQLPAQPDEDVVQTPETEMRERMFARVETVRARLGEGAYSQIVSVLR